MKAERKSKPARNPASEAAQGGQIVLLSVTGESPGVLTETVWALAHEKPPIIPHRVVVITTTKGRDALIEELLSPTENCVWDQLRCRLEGLGHDLTGRLHFGDTSQDIRLFTIFDPKLKRNRPLMDITSEEENLAAADIIMEVVRGLAMDDGVRLVASIAGGRKTMSALLLSVMTLLGKEDDLITHIIVNEPFESGGLKPRFYFRPVNPVIHHGTDRKGNPISISSEKANVQLGKIPFVALRNLFERDLKKKQSYSRLVQLCQVKVEEYARQNVRLTLWRSKPQIKINSRVLTLNPLPHVLMLFLAERVMKGLPPLPRNTSAMKPLQEFCQTVHSEAAAKDYSDWRHEAQLNDTILEQIANNDDQWLRRLRDTLIGALNHAGSEGNELVKLLPRRGHFHLNLPASSITVKT
ncbi:MAG TPA: CRISPR-associated ring nuclease Csm6 [Verrucomicrobiota bacterium]|nr:CRISPR-associated ring nuclease Csm6 [Verrucomicrobiota bacterium]HNT14588.1 CRISPR-associated ring nuclease Csm6 [Verrucomicrobiota bacterium]